MDMSDLTYESADIEWESGSHKSVTDPTGPVPMRVPSADIYWNRILPCLLLKDAAVFESSIENHRLRQLLGFFPPNTSIAATNPLMNRKSSMGNASLNNMQSAHNASASHIDTSHGRIQVTRYSQYGTGTQYSNEITFVVSSEDKLSWLLKRGIFPYDVSMEFVPLMREDKAFLHFMSNIRVLQLKASCSTVGWIFHLLKSLEKFIAHENKSVDDTFIQGFVNQCHVNANRPVTDSVGPHALSTMCFNMEKLSVKSVEHLVTNLSDVKVLRLSDGTSTSFRHHLNLIANNLQQLTTIELWNTNIYDSALEPFKKVVLPLTKIKLFRCPHLSASGVKDLVATNLGIQEFILEQMNITQHSIVGILPCFPALKKVTFWNNYNRYSDVLLKGFAKNCPCLKKLRLHQDSKGDSYTEDGIASLISGCLDIEELELCCDNISYTSLHMLLVRYKITMKKMFVPEKLKAKMDADDGFILANWTIRSSESQ